MKLLLTILVNLQFFTSIQADPVRECRFNGDYIPDNQFCDVFHQCVYNTPIRKICPPSLMYVQGIQGSGFCVDVDSPYANNNNTCTGLANTRLLTEGQRIPSGTCCNTYFTYIGGRLRNETCPAALGYDVSRRDCTAVASCQRGAPNYCTFGPPRPPCNETTADPDENPNEPRCFFYLLDINSQRIGKKQRVPAYTVYNPSTCSFDNMNTLQSDPCGGGLNSQKALDASCRASLRLDSSRRNRNTIFFSDKDANFRSSIRNNGAIISQSGSLNIRFDGRDGICIMYFSQNELRPPFVATFTFVADASSNSALRIDNGNSADGQSNFTIVANYTNIGSWNVKWTIVPTVTVGGPSLQVSTSISAQRTDRIQIVVSYIDQELDLTLVNLGNNLIQPVSSQVVAPAGYIDLSNCLTVGRGFVGTLDQIAFYEGCSNRQLLIGTTSG